MKRTRSENATFVQEALTRLGMHPHQTSRIMQMCGVMTLPMPFIGPFDPAFEVAIEAERDLQILSFILEKCEAKESDKEFVRLIKIALKDSVLPQNDLGNSKGRDSQFELFVAAICLNAGMHPVEHAEPDIRCTVKGIQFGIAAKRTKNVKVLYDRIEKAADQIKKSRLPGIIAIDTCLALNPQNEKILEPILETEFAQLYKTAFTQFLDARHEEIQEIVRGKGVRGIAFHDQQVRLQPDNDWSLCGMTMLLCTARENSRRNREFEAFHDAYINGLPNMSRL